LSQISWTWLWTTSESDDAAVAEEHRAGRQKRPSPIPVFSLGDKKKGC
jgi:hypothetical protein